MPKKTRKIKSKNYIRKRNNASKKGGMLKKIASIGSSKSNTKPPDNESKINECVIVENMLVEKDNDILGYVGRVENEIVTIIGDNQSQYNKSEIKSYQYQDILSLLSNIIAHVVKKPYITKGDTPDEDIKKIKNIKNHLNNVVDLFGNPDVEESLNSQSGSSSATNSLRVAANATGNTKVDGSVINPLLDAGKSETAAEQENPAAQENARKAAEAKAAAAKAAATRKEAAEKAAKAAEARKVAAEEQEAAAKIAENGK